MKCRGFESLRAYRDVRLAAERTCLDLTAVAEISPSRVPLCH